MPITIEEVWQALTEAVVRAQKAEIEISRLKEENEKLNKELLECKTQQEKKIEKKS